MKTIESAFQELFTTFLKKEEYSATFVDMIQHCNRVIQLELPITLQDGSYQRIRAIRVQHNNWNGPYKGGLRFAKDANEEECRGLAIIMTLKCILLNIPFGGGKGAICINPMDYSDADMKTICETFTEYLIDVIGPTKDIPAPDKGSNSRHMDYMVCHYYKFHQNPMCWGAFTGKTMLHHGSKGRDYATGYGVFLCIRYWFEYILKKNIQGTTFIIQGMGNVGKWSTYFLWKEGARCLAIADHTGYYSMKSMDFGQIYPHVAELQPLDGVQEKFKENLQRITKDEFWQTPCDIVIPAATHLQLSVEVAESLSCKIVVEGANCPCFSEVDALLKAKGIELIPDILANSGGVVVSYFEWIQNQIMEQWDENKIDSKLEKQLQETFSTFLEMKTHPSFTNYTNREILFKIALDKLFYLYKTKY